MRMMLKTSLKTLRNRHLLFCFLLSSCGAEPLVGNSVRPATAKEFSFVVSIGYKVAASNMIESRFCSGTVVTNKHVVTTASCLRGKTSRTLRVLGGSNDIRFCDSYDVASWISYNDWAVSNGRSLESESLNIAIITLSKEVDESKIELVLISPKPNKQLFGVTGTLVGWGHAQDGSMSDILQASTVNIPTKERCMEKSNKAATRILVEREKILCTEISTALSNGDEGGPLLYGRNILIGINMKMNCDMMSPKYPKVNHHNSLNNYRRFFYESTGDSQFSVA